MKQMLCIFAIIAVVACEVEHDWPLQNTSPERLVVEGVMTNENKQHTIVLKTTMDTLNQPENYVNGAAVTIHDGSDIIMLEEALERGHYQTDSMRFVVGKSYTLIVQVANQVFEGTAEAVPVLSLKPIQVSGKGADGRFSLTYRESEDPSMMEVIYYWNEVDSISGNIVDRLAKSYFYSIKTIDINKEFSPEREEVRFPDSAIVIRRKYSLSPAHEAFIRSLLSETEWRGSILDEAKGNVITNMSNGALGYFGVSMVESDTTPIKTLVKN